METTNFVKPDNSPFLAVNLLPIREAYEWKLYNLNLLKVLPILLPLASNS